MLAIAGGKGGCGKTTTALGLAAALANRYGVRPVVADADRDAPDLHLMTDVPTEPDLGDLGDGRPLEAVAHESSEFRGVSVVPAPSGALSDGRFHAALDRLSAHDRPVLVDCPAGAGRDAVVPLRVCDAVVLTTTLHAPSLRDATKTAAIADRLGVALAGIVVTRVPEWATTPVRNGHDDSEPGPTTLRSAIVRRVQRLLDTSVVGQVPALDCTGRAVLDHPTVRASYARLADDLQWAESLSFRRPIAE